MKPVRNLVWPEERQLKQAPACFKVLPFCWDIFWLLVVCSSSLPPSCSILTLSSILYLIFTCPSSSVFSPIHSLPCLPLSFHLVYFHINRNALPCLPKKSSLLCGRAKNRCYLESRCCPITLWRVKKYNASVLQSYVYRIVAYIGWPTKSFSETCSMTIKQTRMYCIMNLIEIKYVVVKTQL